MRALLRRWWPGAKPLDRAADLVLALRPVPAFKGCFESGSSGTLSEVLAVLRRIPNLNRVLQPAPDAEFAGPHFSIESGHTLEMRLDVAVSGSQGTAPPAPGGLFCITRLDTDLWTWFRDEPHAPLPPGTRSSLSARPGGPTTGRELTSR